jgi:hypothetical protein
MNTQPGIDTFLDRLQAVVAVQHGHGSVSIQANLGNHVEERLAIADVQALGEVGQEQRLLHLEHCPCRPVR